MPFIRVFEEIGKNDAPQAGGKGASLGEMTRAGIPVPPGFVVLASAFEQFLDETDLHTEIDTILHTVNTAEMRSVEHASEKIQKLILEAKMPEDVATEIHESFAVLNAHFVAVRSSATAEDSASAAWAGQLDTFLNTTEKTLLQNVQRCWASLFTPRAIFYRFEKELHLQKISVAVVVQKMIQSEVSGIAFSVHPVTEDRNQLIIEAGLGLGEAIVSGSITPDSYVVEKEPRRILEKSIAEQERGIFKKGDGGPPSHKASEGEPNKWRDIPTEKGYKQKLSDEEIFELAELVIKIENHYGFPCDIEWAREGGQFFITQSRPITTLTSVSQGDTDENSRRRFLVMVQDYDIPLNPWSSLYEVFNKGIVEVSGGKIKGPDNIFLYEGNKVVWAADVKQFSQVSEYFLERLHADPHFFPRVSKGIRALLPKAKEFTERMRKTDLREKKPQELFQLFQEGEKIYVGLWTWGMVGQFLDMGDDKLSDRLKEKYIPVFQKYGEPEVVFSKLITWLEDTKLAEEATAVLELAANIQSDSILKEKILGAKSYSVLPKEVQNWLDDITEKYCWIQYYYCGPAANVGYYFNLLKRKLQGNPSKELQTRENEKKELKKLQKEVLEEISEEDQNIITNLAELSFLKEARKEGLYLLNYGLDGWYKEIAKRFGTDPFLARYILKSEYEGILTEGVPFIEQTELQGRHDLCAYTSIDGKDNLVVGEAALEWKKALEWPRVPAGASVEEVKGSVAYRGRATGRAVIVNSVKDMEKFREGNILISIATTPVIVPAMNKAAAIVTDTGGVTCHAAIVSRELKTPCVIGTKFATQIFKDGDVVEVDAEKGIVRLLDK